MVTDSFVDLNSLHKMEQHQRSVDISRGSNSSDRQKRQTFLDPAGSIVDLSVPLFQNTGGNYDAMDSEDVPHSVLILHSSNDFTDGNKHSWYELLRDNPFAEQQTTQEEGDDGQMTSDRFAKRVVSLGSNA